MQDTITLHQNREFQTLYRYGVSFVTPFVIVYMRPNRLGQKRLGITAGKRIGNAVHRNRAKRVIRQAYRELASELPGGTDYVIVARSKACYIKSTRLTQYLRKETVPLIWKHWERPKIHMTKGGKQPSHSGETTS